MPSSPPVHLCGRKINDARHGCVFVSSRDEEYAILGPYVAEGARQGERIVQIVGEAQREDHDARMRKACVDVDDLLAKEQLSILRWEDAYLRGGYFDQERTLAMLEGAIADRHAKGFPLLRATGNMDWALQGASGTEQLLEYETRVNFLSMQHPDVFVCAYDVNRFPASTLFDVMRTHPAVVIGGVYHENPFFVPPAAMLDELVARGKAKRA